MKMEKDIRQTVREEYAKIAVQSGSCCCSASSCCSNDNSAQVMSKAIGYSDIEMNAVPEGANLGLGCGNPVAIASLKEGGIVLDLGSGAGFDCFLAANAVGNKGKVIGVDMTPEMIARARENASAARCGSEADRIAPHTATPCAPPRTRAGTWETWIPPMA